MTITEKENVYVEQITLRVRADGELDKSKRDAAIIALESMAVVTFQHNGKSYRVDPMSIIDKILESGKCSSS